MNIDISDFYSNTNVSNCPKNEYPEYALIGRSNVGKSSLINFILGKKIAKISSKPGKTQLINHIVINKSWMLVDLPGYGYAKLSKLMRKKILERTKQYFQKRGPQLVGAFVLIDIRINVQKIDLEWMEWLVKNNIYFIRVFTKCDGLNKNNINKSIINYDNIMRQENWEKIPETIVTSSKKNMGQDEILNKISELNNLFQNI
tara:strand:+ start:2399 stop:3004 length:606 start_codon:yes stop_codon:yes gene_type:complete